MSDSRDRALDVLNEAFGAAEKHLFDLNYGCEARIQLEAANSTGLPGDWLH